MPADCGDANGCTTDVCLAGTCVHRHEGFDAVSCELGKLQTGAASLCAPDPIFAKLATALTLKGTKARNLVGKAENNTKTGQALLNRAAKQLTSLRNRIAKVGDRGKITPACRATLDAFVAERLTLVQGLTTP